MRHNKIFGKLLCLLFATVLAACDGTSLSSSSSSTPSSADASAATATTQALVPDAGKDVVSFSAANYTVAQSAGEVTLTVLRGAPSATASTVHFETSDGSAVAGQNFTAASGDLTWEANDDSAKTVNIPLSTMSFTGTIDFKVVLSDPNEVQLGRIPAAMVTINPTPASATHAAGTVAFSVPTYQVVQSAGSISISVERTSGASGAASVHFATINGSAVAGRLYGAESGTLSWANGDSAAKTINIPVSKTAFAGSADFGIALSQVIGAQLGSVSSATVTITGTGTPDTAASSSAVSTLSLVSSASSVAQSTGSVSLEVNRTGGTGSAVTVKYASANGSAVAGRDYTQVAGTLSWAAGERIPKVISIPLSKTAFSGNRAFTVSLSSPSGGATLGANDESTITIQGSGSSTTTSPTAAVVSLAASATNVAQSAGTVSLAVDRTGVTTSAVTVKYATANGTATAGKQYTATSGTLSWAAGDTAAKTISVPVSKTAFSGSANFSVALSAPTGGAVLGSNARSTVTIVGSGPATAGTAAVLSLASAAPAAPQSAGSVTVAVNRTGSTTAPVSVNYATGNGTAVAGKQYTATSGTLSWAAGDGAVKRVTVPISTAAFAGNMNFSFGLSAPSAGATLGATAQSMVTIMGSGTTGSTSTTAAAPGPTTLALASATYSVVQTAGTAALSVNRSGDTTSAVAVTYATADGTAIAGQNYTATSGTLSWAAGDAAAKTITVPVSSTVINTALTFSVKLGTSTGASLGSPASATVTINKASTLSIAVKGNNLVDAQGNPVRFRGVNISGLEGVSILGWSPDNPWGSQTGDPTPNWTTIKTWGTNAVRIPLNEASWLGLTCIDEGGYGVTVVNGQQVQNKPGQSVKADPGGNYQATLHNTVASATAAGLYIILDLHITAPGNGCPNVQNAMADQDHSIAFWSSIAANFKSYPNVMFELFNEPFLDMASNLQGNDPEGDLLNGGGVLSSYLADIPSAPYQKNVSLSWKNAGMQQMLDAVRATGATNVVLVGNNSYSDDINNWLKYKANDPAAQLAASWHTYPGDDGVHLGCIGGQPACDGTVKAAAVGVRTAGYPVVITEFGDAIGGSAPFVHQFIPWADGAGINGYFGWTWDVWGGMSSNVLITNAAGAPTAGYGTYVKAHYLCLAAGNASCP